MRAEIPTMQHGMSDASRILVTARASSVPRPLLEAGFSSHSSDVASEKDGGGDVLVVEEALRQFDQIRFVKLFTLSTRAL